MSRVSELIVLLIPNGSGRRGVMAMSKERKDKYLAKEAREVQGWCSRTALVTAGDSGNVYESVG